jgi:enamine deaminase RidA (YjgF/YER057c/UK114 family)
MTPPTPDESLASRGIVLPAPPTPKGAYVPVVVHGGLAWVSGMLPMKDGELVAKGLVGSDVAPSKAKEAARWAALNGLSALRSSLGGLAKVERILRVGVFVASAPTFTSQPEVANGASELLVEVFGEAGRHARVAVGTTRLPLDSSVEVEMLVALRT